VADQTQHIPFAPIIDPKNRNLDYKTITAIGLLHVGCIGAFFLPIHWTSLVLCLLFVWIGGNLGITLAYHRLLTHRSFKTPKWFEYLITICGCLEWQGGPIRWVGTHRLHHKESDHEADPHTPKHGFLWAHMTWCMHRDHADFKPYEAAKDLTRDPVHVFLDKYFYLPQFILGGLLYAGGYLAGEYLFAMNGHMLALSWVVWAICIRTVATYHGTWFVNSATHTWGYRNFNTTDDSRNSWWVAFVSFGEGWHNNHHAFQRSAAHGLKWWEFDMTWLQIKFLSLIGLAKEIQLPSEEELAKRAA